MIIESFFHRPEKRQVIIKIMSEEKRQVRIKIMSDNTILSINLLSRFNGEKKKNVRKRCTR